MIQFGFISEIILTNFSFFLFYRPVLQWTWCNWMANNTPLPSTTLSNAMRFCEFPERVCLAAVVGDSEICLSPLRSNSQPLYHPIKRRSFDRFSAMPRVPARMNCKITKSQIESYDSNLAIYFFFRLGPKLVCKSSIVSSPPPSLGLVLSAGSSRKTRRPCKNFVPEAHSQHI